MRHNIVKDAGVPISVTVFYRGKILTAATEHPNFHEILTALEQKRPAREVAQLFDQRSLIARGFKAARALIDAAIAGFEEGVKDEAERREAPTEPTAKTPPRKKSTAKKAATKPGDGAPSIMETGLSKTRMKHLAKVAGQVEIKGGDLYFGGEKMHGALAETIIKYRAEKRDFMPLVLFMGKIMQNPNPHSREHLYQWMQHLSFFIADDGDLIAYKGVHKVGKDTFTSTTGGPNTKVNGILQPNGRIKQKVGDVVSMDRTHVTFDPANGCARGLHIGTVDFGAGYGNAMIEVKVDPRNVVSVPTDNEWKKLRVCGYEVRREVTREEARELRSKANSSAKLPV